MPTQSNSLCRAPAWCDTKSAVMRRAIDGDRQAAKPYLEARKVLQCKADTKKSFVLVFLDFHQWWNKWAVESARNSHALKWGVRFRVKIITATAQPSWSGVDIRQDAPLPAFWLGGSVLSIPPVAEPMCCSASFFVNELIRTASCFSGWDASKQVLSQTDASF